MTDFIIRPILPFFEGANGDSLKYEFWDQVAVGHPDECWEWQGRKHRTGYGVFRAASRNHLGSHRVALVLHLNDDGHGLLALHSCDNRPCCNPNHLRFGTIADNMRDKMKRGRYKNGVSLGLQNGRAKLNRETIEKMVKAFREGKGDTQVKRELGLPISISNVRNIRLGNSWVSETSKLGWPENG